MKALNLLQFFCHNRVNDRSPLSPLIFLELISGLMVEVEVMGVMVNELGDLLLDIGKCLEFDLMKEIKCVF